MAVQRLILRSRRVVTPDGLAPAEVVVEGERIAGIEPIGGRRAAPANVEDLGDLVLMPGIVDAHVHVNEPGRTEWEGFAHATRAAAAGGVTTLADMPLNSDPVTTSVEALAAKRAAAEGQCWVDVGFHAGIVPANAARRDQILDLDARGVLAWKAFLCDSGLADFPASTRADLEAAMPVLAEAGARLLVHAELARDA
ncbi:MAG TPA: amidohydrolase family protein, partial [Thermoanaerobaculia bacterium]|nr:amidohydrolase family protein [Thermoanaerobaculia bacterium]